MAEPVTLREIDAATVRAVCALSVSDAQRRFVAPNAVSLAEAHFNDHAWFRAVYRGDRPVGFVMLEDDPSSDDVFLWRFMIDAAEQGAGVGRRALELVVDHVRARPGAVKLSTTVVEGDGGPRGFYERAGFVSTGEYEEGELLLELDLSA